MSIELTDDGTMDTVLRCDECGEEFRFNYDATGGTEDEYDLTNEEMEAKDEEEYNAFVDDCIAEIEQEHECTVICDNCGCAVLASEECDCQGE
jgi:hypothetical protein